MAGERRRIHPGRGQTVDEDRGVRIAVKDVDPSRADAPGGVSGDVSLEACADLKRFSRRRIKAGLFVVRRPQRNRIAAQVGDDAAGVEVRLDGGGDAQKKTASEMGRRVVAFGVVVRLFAG